jgi:hypothetical protein
MRESSKIAEKIELKEDMQFGETNLNSFLRFNSVMLCLFFDSGKVLLISEKEADKISVMLWKNRNAVTAVHFKFFFAENAKISCAEFHNAPDSILYLSCTPCLCWRSRVFKERKANASHPLKSLWLYHSKCFGSFGHERDRLSASSVRSSGTLNTSSVTRLDDLNAILDAFVKQLKVLLTCSGSVDHGNEGSLRV